MISSIPSLVDKSAEVQSFFRLVTVSTMKKIQVYLAWNYLPVRFPRVQCIEEDILLRQAAPFLAVHRVHAFQCHHAGGELAVDASYGGYCMVIGPLVARTDVVFVDLGGRQQMLCGELQEDVGL